MTILLAMKFVFHRSSCRVDFYCETCDNDAPLIAGIVIDVVLLLIGAILGAT